MNFNIKTLRLINGTTYTPVGGKNQPGLSMLSLIDEGIQALGYPSPNSCCYSGTAPINGSVLAWDSTLKKFVLSTATGSGSTNLGGSVTASNILLTSSSGSGFTLPLATATFSGLYSPSHFSFVANAIINGSSSTQSITGNGTPSNPFKLVNDSATPGNSLYYGTDATGVKGYFALPSGGGGVSNLALGTLTGTTNQITNSNGTGFTLNQATTTNAGLLSNTDQVKLNNVTGTNTGDITVTDSGSVDFTLAGQNITAKVTGITAATVGQFPAKGSGDTIVWTTITGSGTIDAVPTNGSTNAVSSDGTFDALGLKINSAIYSALGILPFGGTSGSIVTLPLGSNNQVLTVDNTTATGTKWATPSSGSANTKYAVAVTGSAGIIVRVYGSPGITVTKTNASTITFTTPAGGYLENYQIFYPAAENPGSNATHVFQYTSNTITNQGLSTSDAPNMMGWFASGLPAETYHARAVGSSADFVNSITAVGLGNITILTNFGTTGLSSGDIMLKGNF